MCKRALLALLCVLSILTELGFDSTSSFIRVGVRPEAVFAAAALQPGGPGPALESRGAAAPGPGNELRAARSGVISHCADPAAFGFRLGAVLGVGSILLERRRTYRDPDRFALLRPPIRLS